MRRSLFGVVILMISAWLAAMPLQAASSFADPAFETQWKAGEAAVPNFWGPLANARDGQKETYGGGPRLVQYFDKARMELNTSGGPVTAGLLTNELKTGKMQVGDSSFEQRQPAKVNVAGDAGADGPTYADLASLPDPEVSRDTASPAVFSFNGGTFQAVPANDPLFKTLGDAPFVYTEDFGYCLGHCRSTFKPFKDFIAGLPLRIDQTTGFPIGPAFFAKVKIAGTPTTVLVQPFERRVLTYNPNNPPATRVEFGNIGQHYYTWRYLDAAAAVPPPAPTVAPPSPITFLNVKGAPASGTASVAIQGPPTTLCSITYTTPAGTVSSATGLEPKTTTAAGLASWTWTIAPGTKSGMGTLAVNCAGKAGTSPITIG